MPTPAYMSLEGTKQGLITAGTFTEDSVGNIFQEGHEDQILVQAFNHQVIIPRVIRSPVSRLASAYTSR
jgi:type VI secretion system secreted protein Hcp